MYIDIGLIDSIKQIYFCSVKVEFLANLLNQAVDINKKSAFGYEKSLIGRSYLKVLETRILKRPNCDQEMKELKRDMFDYIALVNSNKDYKEIIKLLIEYDNNSITN